MAAAPGAMWAAAPPVPGPDDMHNTYVVPESTSTLFPTSRRYLLRSAASPQEPTQRYMNKNLQIVGSTGSAPFINALGVAFSDIPRTQRTVEAPWSTMRWDDGFVPLDGARTLTVQAEGITYTARLPLLANPIVSATTTATTT